MVSFPSIFNDVLGPVMRGPSSSHSAASLRIGRMALDLMDSDIKSVTVDYDPNGSLVTTHLSQGSDLGLTGGILGWETDDPRLPNYRDEVIKAGIDIEVRYLDYGAEHPNTYQLTLRGNLKEHVMTAISTGGGMIEIQKIDGIPVNMKGDYHNLHNHPHSWLSGTYYISVPDQSDADIFRSDLNPGAISFFDPRPQANMNAIRNDGQVDPEHRLLPSAGDLYLWPAFLHHLVHPNMADLPRISISFNVVLKWKNDYIPH